MSDVLTLSFRNLLAHKVRLALTVTAVTLGVAFVSGAFVLSDTMGKAFDQLFGDVAAGSDVTVRARSHDTTGHAPASTRPIEDTLVTTVADVPGVDLAEGSVTGYALVLDTQRKPVRGGDGGSLGGSLHTDPTLGNPYSVEAGRAPRGSGEIALDVATAAKAGYRPGDLVHVMLESGPATFTLAGTLHFGTDDGSTLAGASMAAFDLPTAQKVLGRDGRVDQIDVRAQEGADPADVRDRIASTLPRGVEAVSSTDVAAAQSRAVRDNLGMFTSILVGFAAVSLVVGAFVIWNTFNVLVVQRRREVALMRAVGATRRQVVAGLVAEAALVGLASAAFGLAAGAGLSAGLLALLDATGVDIPSTSLVVGTRTVVVALLVGLVVTVAAAVFPAAGATKVAPVEALRDATPASAAPSRRRTVTGVLLMGAGTAALAAAAATPAMASLAWLGAAVAFAGLVVAGPQLARALAWAAERTAGRTAGSRGSGWRLAARNVARAPQRAAVTALALTIGLTVVAGAAVVAASTKASVADAVRGGNRADVILKPAGAMAMGGLSPAVAETLRARSSELGVDAVAELRFVPATAHPAGKGGTSSTSAQTNVGGINPRETARVLDLDVSAGSLRALREGTVLLSAKQAKQIGAGVGDQVDITFAETGRRSFTVAGVFERDALIGAGYLLSLRDYVSNVTSKLDSSVMVRFVEGRVARGVDPAEAVEDALRPYPDVTIKDQAAFVAEQQAHVDEMLGLVTAMLLLAVVVAVLGIVNTLVLSVVERLRELGVLRAVGGTRRQVRSLIRRESVLIALLGAATGTALGVGIGVAASRALDGQGITSLAVPVVSLTAYLVVATLVGVLAAVGPARRASRVDVLAAIAAE